MTYSELLKEQEWKEKCFDILSRDNHTCLCCGRIGYHNSYSYLQLDSLEKLYKILEPYSFYGHSFKEYFEGGLYKDNNEGLLEEECTSEQITKLRGKKIYALRTNAIRKLFYFHERKPLPLLVSDKDVEKIKAKIYGIKTHGHNSSGEDLVSLPCLLYELSDYCFDNIYMINAGDIYESYSILYVCYKNYAMAFSLTIHETNLSGLNVHHKYYIHGKKPWEYENDALITLCESCHQSFHQNNSVPIYRSVKYADPIGIASVCKRCGGSGYFPQYSHIQDGICFECGGEGISSDML